MCIRVRKFNPEIQFDLGIQPAVAVGWKHVVILPKKDNVPNQAFLLLRRFVDAFLPVVETAPWIAFFNPGPRLGLLFASPSVLLCLTGV